MTQVLFTFVNPDGTPLTDTEFSVQLRKAGLDPLGDSLVVPQTYTFVTNAQGTALLDLQPSTSVYTMVMVRGGEQCGGIRYKFYVPHSDEVVNAEELYLAPPPNSEPWDEVAIAKLTQAVQDVKDGVVAAEGSATEAAASAASADFSKTAAADSAADALVSEKAAVGSASAAAESAATASAKASEATASAAASLDSKNESVSSAADSLQSASEAMASENAAASSATAAANSAAEAKADTTAARNSAAAASASQESAATSATAAAVSAATATTKANESAASAAAALASNNAAAVSATGAAGSATGAAGSATEALASKNAAAASATASANSASEAMASENAAASSATAAAASVGTATTKASEATASATTATTQAGTATTQANRAKTEADRATAATEGKQPLNANLTALSGLGGAADRVPYFTEAGAMAVSALSAQGRTLVAEATAAGQRTALGLGNAATFNVVSSTNDNTPERLMAVGYAGIGRQLSIRYLPDTTTNRHDVITRGLGLSVDIISSGDKPAGVQDGPMLTMDFDAVQGLNVLFDWRTGTMYTYTDVTPAPLKKWRMGYHEDNVVGTIDNKAIIERGSNVNGEFVKFADGTLICTARFTGYVAGTPKTYPFPAAFVIAPTPFISVTPSESFDSDYMGYIPNTTSWTFWSKITANNVVVLGAIGRWK